MASVKKYDLVVFGATGFTGKYVAEEVYRIQMEGKQKFTWAAAGRNEEKVQRALADLNIEGVDVIRADVNDQESIEAMCGCTRVVVDVVGPYVLYGEQVVKACINQRCDYVDITGEPYFIESMMVKYGEAAKEAGIYIVNCCGYDSVPNDIGSVLLQKSINGELAYIETYMSTNFKGFNIGTWESAVRSFKYHKELKELHKKVPLPTLPSVKMPRRRFLFYSDVTNSWCVPMQGADKSCILRTANYFNLTNGTPLYRCNAFFSVGSLPRVIGFLMVFTFIVLLSLTNWGTKLLLKYPEFFTFGLARKTGPTRSEIEKSTFTITLDGGGYSSDNVEKAKPDVFLRVRVRGAEPGYVATSAMMVQCAFCLINERANLPTEGGIYTPGAAFGKTNIIQNIEQTGKVRFTVEQI